MKHYEIDIEIDEITPCLKNSSTNLYVDTYYEKIDLPSHQTALEMQKYEHWHFDWSAEDLEDCSIYALYVKDSRITQGLIACRDYAKYGDAEGYIEVVLAEANPKNVGQQGIYKGVGAHLFAIACKMSFNLGYNGYVGFTSKTDLIDHYIETLHAQVLFDRQMQLDTEAATYLVSVYDKKASDMDENN